MTRGAIPALAVAAGIYVACAYYNQAMLVHIAREYNLKVESVAGVAALTQFGNAVGILLLAPLGDKIDRRLLIVWTSVLLFSFLMGSAVSPTLPILLFTSFFVGVFSSATQQIIPLGYQVAEEGQRGQALGLITGSLLAGIMLSRFVSGLISDLLSWRHMFVLASFLTVIAAALVWIKTPRLKPATDTGYIELMASMVSLLFQHSTVWKTALSQALIFAAFMAFWANSAFLLSSDYNLGATAVGVLALIGAVGALAAPLAGRVSDHHGSRLVAIVSTCLVLLAFVLLAGFAGSIVAVAIAVIILDIGTQSSQVANQSHVNSLDAAARYRLNTIFMTSMVLGGAIGTSLGSAILSRFSWNGLWIFAGTAAAVAFLISYHTKLSVKENIDVN